jgi:hypothetical protein
MAVQIGSGMGMEMRGRSSQPRRGRATEHHKEQFEMRCHGTLWWLPTMSGVDYWVLQSKDCSGSGLESEQPGPQPCQHKVLARSGYATWFGKQWGNS